MLLRELISEAWSDKYKHSINCSNPKGFSQKAHCAGRKKNEDVELNELNVAKTLDFIKQAHGDQLYGKLPYWTHPRAVALTGKKIFGSMFNSNAVKVAFLHDVVEDTNIGLDELSKLGFEPVVIQAVGLLTKDKTLGYSQNIERIISSGNPLAMMVKYADNYENYTGDKSDWDPKRASSSQKKYLMSLNMLGDKLGVKHHVGEDQHPNDTPAGPETKPTMPAGTVRVDVDDVYDWYKLGQHISNMKGLGTHDFGQGPPSTIFSFGSEEEEHEYIKALKKTGLTTTDIDPVDPKQPKGMPRQKTDPTFNVDEAKKRKRKIRYAAYGPGPYGLYGTNIGYSSSNGGDGGGGGESIENENFADGKKPGRKGLAKRSGVNTKASVSSLRKTAKNSTGEKARMAHWLANMKAGKAKKNETLTEAVIHPSIMDALEDFLPFVMKLLKLDKLPRISVHKTINTGDQPSFGGYNPGDGTIQLALKDRHPADILRTLAHELVHFKQDQLGQLNDDSGITGSSEENEANTKAGIIMRHFNKRFPQYLE